MQNFIAVIAFIFIFSSCKDNSENNLAVFRVAEEGLQMSNKNISASTRLIYQALNEKTNAYSSKERAEVWKPKAMEIKRLSDSIINYIRQLKDELKDEEGRNKDWENNLTVANHVFESHGKGKELVEKLLVYRQGVLAIDPGIKNKFENRINVIAEGFDYNLKDTANFTKAYFNKIPLIAAFVVLSKFENNVKIFENEVVAFCDNQTGSVDGGLMFSKFSFLAAQNSTYLKAGEELEISAGVGELSDACKPQFTINGKNIPLNEEAVAIYKFRTPSKAGKYFVPVKVDFISEVGIKKSLTKKVEYTVIE